MRLCACVPAIAVGVFVGTCLPDVKKNAASILLRHRFQREPPASFIPDNKKILLQLALENVRPYGVHKIPWGDSINLRLSYVTRKLMSDARDFRTTTSTAVITHKAGDVSHGQPIRNSVNEWVQGALGLWPALRCDDWTALLPTGHNVLFIQEYEALFSFVPSDVISELEQLCEDAKRHNVGLTIIVLQAPKYWNSVGDEFDGR